MMFPGSGRWSSPWVVCTLVLLATFASGCRREQMMANQPRFEPLEASEFYTDRMSARPIVEGTVPRGALRDDKFLHTGREGGELVDSFPFPVTMQVMKRGEGRFEIYCAPCHGETGRGDGMIVRRGFRKPPTFHTTSLRTQRVGYIFDVITNGFGAMPAYGGMISAEDRWAIVAYIRALQLSQGATLVDVPQAKRGELDTPAVPATTHSGSRPAPAEGSHR